MATPKKSPEQMSARGLAQLDLTPKPRKKYGAGATPEGKAKRIAALRKTPVSNTIALIEAQNPDRPLTEKQKLFVKLWAQGESILSASYRAGYSDSGAMAYRLARDPAILKIYDREKALYEASCQITRKMVMEGFLEAAQMAKIQADPVAMTGAWREVGKMCGYYEPVKRTIDVTLSGNVTVKKLEGMSDADLVKIIKGEVEDVEFSEETSEE